MADLSKLVLNGAEFNLKDASAREDISRVDNTTLKKYIGPTKDVQLYIAPDGNDDTGDGSSDRPFFSINKAIRYFHENYTPNFSTTHILSIICKQGTYKFNESQVVRSFNKTSQYATSTIRIVAHGYSSSTYENMTLEEVKNLNTLPVIFDFSDIDSSIYALQIKTGTYLYGIHIKSNSRAFTCYEDYTATNTIGGSDAYSEAHNLKKIKSGSVINVFDGGELYGIENCIIEGGNVGILLYNDNWYNIVNGNFLKIKNCYTGMSSYGRKPFQIDCKNLVFDTFNNAFGGGIKMKGVFHVRAINILANNWNYGTFLGSFSSVEFPSPSEYSVGYNRWSTGLTPLRFIQLNPSTTAISDANNAHRQIWATYTPDESGITTRDTSAHYNGILGAGWQVKFGSVDITNNIRYQTSEFLFKTLPASWSTMNDSKRQQATISSLPCDIQLFNSLRNVVYSIRTNSTFINETNYIQRKWYNLTNTRVYQYGTLSTTLTTQYTKTINFPYAFSTRDGLTNNSPRAASADEIVLIVTPLGSGSSVVVTSKTLTGFTVTATGSFSWMAMNANDAFNGYLP